ncbi:hypothetical protein C3942_00755 [Solimonas fluminis]|uniref:Uncharacterized protein n=1 Tax=Solimonas fluminis TaxID=2086571 RepID=A0A2S5TL22_9GAMM|nr:hypothetical protein [Solimonas fluminis]PPE75458.1 hypothetical protein C3942_00755 [Solimonas fluminis]
MEEETTIHLAAQIIALKHTVIVCLGEIAKLRGGTIRDLHQRAVQDTTEDLESLLLGEKLAPQVTKVLDHLFAMGEFAAREGERE